MFKKILIGAVVLVLGLVGLVLAQPSTYVVERSANVSAPAATTFALVNDFHHWDRWSPWAKLDPSQTTTYEGPAFGKGAIQKWTGNDKVGEGQMTILDSKDAAQVDIRLEFIRPFASVAQPTLQFAPQQDGATKVTWRMSGENGFISKAMSLVMDMDTMIGADFEKGLAAMKTAAEADAQKAAAAAAQAEAAKVAEAAAAQAEAEAMADAEGEAPEGDMPKDAVAAPAAP